MFALRKMQLDTKQVLLYNLNQDIAVVDFNIYIWDAEKNSAITVLNLYHKISKTFYGMI